jgi:RNA polymerase sigma factor (sigma-70 family)
MLGSVSEAEDVVQEAFLRLHHRLQDGERIESPRAYLSTVVTRLCINHLRSARARRETYLEALPEPLVGEPGEAHIRGSNEPRAYSSRSATAIGLHDTAR